MLYISPILTILGIFAWWSTESKYIYGKGLILQGYLNPWLDPFILPGNLYSQVEMENILVNFLADYLV